MRTWSSEEGGSHPGPIPLCSKLWDNLCSLECSLEEAYQPGAVWTSPPVNEEKLNKESKLSWIESPLNVGTIGPIEVVVDSPVVDFNNTLSKKDETLLFIPG